jgi:hypothetical protein
MHSGIENPLPRLSPLAAAIAGSVARTDLNPRLHLAIFAAAASPVVAMLGDSVSTGPDTPYPMAAFRFTDSLPNPLAPSEIFWVLLKRKIRRDNPNKNITFKNFAIGGQGWVHAAGTIPTQFPSWYTDHGAAWLTYIEAAAPDLLVIQLGANDGVGLTATQVKSALTTINGWAKVPSIVIVTNWEAANPTGGADTRAGERANANFLRTLCHSDGARKLFGLTNLPPLGLIDLGRLQQLVEYGVDPAIQSLKEVLSAVSVPAGSV